MEEKRSNLNKIWEKIEAIKTRELKDKMTATVGVIADTLKQGLSQFDDFIDGNFDNSVIFLGKEYTDEKMISYVNDLSEVMQKDNLSWLKSMAIDEVFVETLNVCPKLLTEIFAEEKSNGYDGLPITFNKSLRVQNSIPAMKFLTKNEFIGNLLKEGTKEIDLNQLTKVLSQSQKNIDVILEHADSCSNLNEVFEKFPTTIKVFDQNLLLDEKKGPKIIHAINKAAENNEKVKNFSEFYLSFFLGEDGKIAAVKSIAEQQRETLDPIEERRQRALLNIKAITEREENKNRTPQNPHIQTRLKK